MTLHTASPKELSAPEAAAHLGWALGTLYNRVKEIRHRKQGGVLWFSVEALDEFMAAQSQEHVPWVKGS